MQLKREPSLANQPSKQSDATSASKFIVKQWQNTNGPFPTGPSRFFIVGSSNTGKTTLACRIIKKMLVDERDPKNQLIIISPNYKRDEKLQNLANFAASAKLYVRVYQSFDNDGISAFVDYMDQSCLDGLRTTVFVDDPVGVGSFTSNVNQKSPFNSFVTGIKHYRCDIVFSTQAIGSMSRSARKNVDVFIFMPDIISREELFKSCRFVSTQEEFDRLMDKYAASPFHALWINVQFGRKGVYAVNDQGNISAITSVPR